MSLEEALQRFLREYSVGPSRLLVAVSGGSDSTALLLALSELRSDGYSIVAGHVNHGLRGAESEDDEAFVQGICRGLDLEFHVRRGELPPEDVRERGIEAAAREVRYAALNEIRQETQSAFLATAHTRRDQAETVLMRFLTGSGTTRLQGISPATASGILRPLLEVDREDVLDFLAARGVFHREDRSNEDERFLRNRIRGDIMPRLLEINPKLVSTLCETASQARSEAAALDQVVLQSSSGWVREQLHETKFVLEHSPRDPWLLQAVLSRQIQRLEPGLREVSARDLKRLIQDFPNLRRTSVSGSLELSRQGSVVTLSRRGSRTQAFEHEVLPGTSVYIPELRRRIKVERRPAVEETAGNVFQLPPDESSPAFVVRSRRAGDTFHPTGRSSARSLSDYLIERRIPRGVRDSIPLLTWRGDIVSVWGVGIAEPCRVRDGSQEVYVIVLEEAE